MSDLGLRIQKGLIQGRIAHGELTVVGAKLSGWLQFSSEARGPAQIVVVASGEIATRSFLEVSNSVDQVPFDVVVDASFFRSPLFIELKVYALDSSNSGDELPMSGTAAELASIKVGSRPDLLRLVQSPTERTKNQNLLFYISYHAFDRFSDDFAARSAMLCTMGYRLLDGLSVPDSARQVFWNGVESVLKSNPNVPKGLWLRWHTSVRLCAGYVAFREKKMEAAARYFDGIGDFAFDLAHWPAALTNILIGIFLAGWTHYERHEFPQAAQAWQRAEGVLRYGGSTAQFQNFYAYGELANAIKVAQECYIGRMQAEAGGKPIDDPRIIPAGYHLDIRHLPGLFYNLGLS